MPLINCPECGKQISDRADACPHCGLPSKFFAPNSAAGKPLERQTEPSNDVDYSLIRNTVISFDHAYQTAFGANHYITSRELANLEHSFKQIASILADKSIYDYCETNAHSLSIDMAQVNSCLRRYETLKPDAESHNAEYIDRIVEQNGAYFDALLRDIDPNIMLDDEQRRAVVADDDYCLLVAGAGAGKTTTMAAKVKYLVEKKRVAPEDIIVISYTKKAIDELKDRVNKHLGIPARICTFHSFAYDIVRQFSDSPPEVNYSAFNIILEMLEKEIFNNKSLLRKVLLFMGYYFDIPNDALNYETLDQYHLAKAAQDFETIKSGAGEYVQKVMRQRDKTMRTLSKRQAGGHKRLYRGNRDKRRRSRCSASASLQIFQFGAFSKIYVK